MGGSSPLMSGELNITSQLILLFFCLNHGARSVRIATIQIITRRTQENPDKTCNLDRYMVVFHQLPGNICQQSHCRGHPDLVISIAVPLCILLSFNNQLRTRLTASRRCLNVGIVLVFRKWTTLRNR